MALGMGGIEPPGARPIVFSASPRPIPERRRTMSRRLLFAAGGALLACAPLAAAPPDPDGKPAGDAAVVAAATADRTLRAESLDGAIVNTIYLDGDGTLRIIRDADGGTTT